MDGEIEQIGAKLDALGLWDRIQPFHWALRPRGTVMPYFCSVLKGDGSSVKVRFLLLEGWQTFHDYVLTRMDRNYGFYSTPMEMAHFELVVLTNGECRVFRHDPGFMPIPLPEARRGFCAKLLWEAYGVMLRVETDERLPLAFSGEKAMFSRVEAADGTWRDEPLAIPDAPPYTERIMFPKALVAAAKDLPFATDAVVEADFRLRPGVMTREPRPRCAYALVAIDGKSGERLVFDQRSADADSGLKGMWESVPPRLVEHLVKRGSIPGEIRLKSGRLFRMLRPLCVHLPFKLRLCDSLPQLDRAFAELK